MLKIRNVTLKDLIALVTIEHLCFPKEEAAAKEAFEQRIRFIPDSFFAAEIDGVAAGLINGPVIETSYITDDLFGKIKENPDTGGHQSILGLAVSPQFQHRGVASALLAHLEKEARAKMRKSITLTCKEDLISFYEKFGYQNHGVSSSEHGGVTWYNMCKILAEAGGVIQIKLKDKAKALPVTPGVYLMKDEHGGIIYVGKAKNLKRRVLSYSQKSASHSPKVVKLVNNVKDFDFILTDTEFEAFMLECKLIKEIKPFFNKKMKNTQSYTFITISIDDEIPWIKVPKEANSNKPFFGPFISKNTVEKALQALKDFYKIDCSSPVKRNSPCLNYSLGMCIGMCFKDEAEEQYRAIIQKIFHLLDGTDMSILDEMKQRMANAAEELNFALAAKYRDDIELLNFLLYKEKVIGFAEENQNIAVIEYLSGSMFKLFLIRRNRVLFSGKFNLDSTSAEELMKKMIIHFKEPCSYFELSKVELDEAQIIYSYLQSGNCNYTIIPDKWLKIERIELVTTVRKLMGRSPR